MKYFQKDVKIMKLKIIKTTKILSTLLCTTLLCGCLNTLGTFKVGGLKLHTPAVLVGLGVFDPDSSWNKNKRKKENEHKWMNGIKSALDWKPFAKPKEVELKEISEINNEEEGLVIQEGPSVVIMFDEVPIGETFGFIAHTTGKKVVVDGDENLIREKKITLLNDEPIDRSMVVDLLFKEFKLKQVGVDELEDTIVISSLE